MIEARRTSRFLCVGPFRKRGVIARLPEQWHPYNDTPCKCFVSWFQSTLLGGCCDYAGLDCKMYD